MTKESTIYNKTFEMLPERKIYWNPNGVAQSYDYNIRTICYNYEKYFDGKNILSYV